MNKTRRAYADSIIEKSFSSIVSPLIFPPSGPGLLSHAVCRGEKQPIDGCSVIVRRFQSDHQILLAKVAILVQRPLSRQDKAFIVKNDGAPEASGGGASFSPASPDLEWRFSSPPLRLLDPDRTLFDEASATATELQRDKSQISPAAYLNRSLCTGVISLWSPHPFPSIL
jgi:hypothetical protein